jgi:transcriptional regulator with XRE-family HTH domain
MKAPELVGRNVKGYREKMGISQEKLADIAGLHRTYITQVEQGKRNLTVNNVFRLAEALEIEPNLLLVKDSWKE